MKYNVKEENMKAFVMKGIGKVGFIEKPDPRDPGPNDAIIKTTRALICTSDTHTVGGAIGDRKDLTLGHEAVGVVYKSGSEVTGVKEGDRVAVNAITPCYKCENCLRGYTSQCTQMLGGWKFANIKDGVFAEYFHVNDAQANLAPIPKSVPDEAAVYTTDMMSTGFMGAEHANILYEMVRGLPHMQCYLVNTGWIGEGDQYRPVRLEYTLTILDCLLRGELQNWVDSPSGFKVPAAVRLVDDLYFHPERLYSQAEFETKQKELNGWRHEAIERVGSGLHSSVRAVF